MGSTLKGTISLLINETILNFLNEFREFFDQGASSKKERRISDYRDRFDALNDEIKRGFFKMY